MLSVWVVYMASRKLLQRDIRRTNLESKEIQSGLSKKQSFFIIFILILLVGAVLDEPANLYHIARVLILSILYWGMFEIARYLWKQFKSE